MKYIKTVPIEAEQFDGSQIMANKYDINLLPKSLNIGLLPTLEGSLKLRTGDWIATGATYKKTPQPYAAGVPFLLPTHSVSHHIVV